MGTRSQLAIVNSRLCAIFHQLEPAAYRWTSLDTIQYNCLAWAACDSSKRWDRPPDYYWPSGIALDWTIENVVAVLATVGFKPCESLGREWLYEKVAIYSDPSTGEATHFARQRVNGWWTSKLGDLEDIEHRDLSQLEGSAYGYATHAVKRTWFRKWLEATKRIVARVFSR